MRVLTLIAVSLMIIGAVSGCVANNEPSVATDVTDDMGMGDNETVSLKAVIVVIDNGTEIFSTDADTSGSGGTATGGNATGGNTTSTGNQTGGNQTGGNTTSSAPGNSTGNSTSEPTNSTSTSEPGGFGFRQGNQTNATGNETTNMTGDVTVDKGVNITFDGSRSEGENLTFSWTLGNVTGENESIVHLFNETGTFNVTLTITDATNATDEVTVEVSVAGGAMNFTEVHEFDDGSLFGGTPTCTSVVGTDSTEYELAINDTANGTPVQAMSVLLEGNGRLTLLDPDGEELGQEEDELTVAGPLPAGTYTIEFRLCGVSGSSAVTATVTYLGT